VIIEPEENKPWIGLVIKRCAGNQGKTILGLLLITAVASLFGAYGRLPQRVRGLLAKPEHIYIDIKGKDYLKIVDKREEALTNGMLTSSPDDFVPAKIRYKDRVIPVKLRLKGDMKDHWEGEKWSFRIVVEGENTLFGMKQLSIQHPRTRAYIYEWLYHQALRREGVLSLRYQFIDVTLNGKHLGVYALEEHFEKRLIENGRLREGPIVRFNEDLFWAELAKQDYLPVWERKPLTGSSSYLSSDIDAFQTKKALADPASYAQYVKAVQLLEAFRRGVLKPSEVFDVDKLARFFAISDLMSASHGASNWANVRFYYNPITSRLEPIGFDAYDRELLPVTSIIATLPGRYSSEHGDNPYRYLATLFGDRELLRQYIDRLEKVSEESYIEDLLSELAPDLQENLDIIHRDFPSFDFSRDVFYQNQRYIKQMLNPVKGLHAYYRGASNNDITLELGNIQYLPVEVVSLSYKGESTFQPSEDTVLPGTDRFQPVQFRIVSFPLPKDFVWSEDSVQELKLNYRILGERQTREETVFRWSHLDYDAIQKDFIRQKPDVRKFKFLIVDESTKRILIKPGVWDLNENLIIPGGYRVISREGTTLNLSNSATLLSYSAIDFVGTEDHPITIQSIDGTGQGVVIMNAGEQSILDHVVFRNLSAPSQGGWELLGAVNFYESPVAISSCQFLNSRAEDGINIIRSQFTIDRSHFGQTLSDAIDVDFAKGKVTNSFFAGCGNDAIDVSGSSIDIQNVFIDGAGDKGVSAGENSHVRINHIEIKRAQIALGSKDMSEVVVRDVNMADCRIGLTAYQKKPEYGSASIRATGCEVIRTGTPYLLEHQSTMVIDGRAIKPSRSGVEEFLYGVEHGKGSTQREAPLRAQVPG
jgi:hypothetical protein